MIFRLSLAVPDNVKPAARTLTLPEAIQEREFDRANGDRFEKQLATLPPAEAQKVRDLMATKEHNELKSLATEIVRQTAYLNKDAFAFLMSEVRTQREARNGK
jgi:hypothetical protein